MKKYTWKGISYPLQKDDRKKLNKNLAIALNVL